MLDKFKYTPEVKKITKKKNLPKYIVNNNNIRHIQKASKHRKLKNMELNSSKIDNNVYKSEKIDKIVDTNIVDR